MNYYEGDYRAIGYAPAAGSIISKLGASAAPLYNGNIAAMSVNIPVLGGGAKVYNYKYDQLNRIVSMDLFDGLAIGNSGYSLSQQQAYKERVSYDPNGNILRYVRNGPSTGLAMDSLIYGYTAGSNRLHKVVDSITHANAYSDIKPGQADNNYKYDEIGNLISDNSEGITSVSWNVYGKITQIVKSTGTIKYTYDASGNRVMKITPSDTTVYVRDASGNVMAVYTATGTLSLAEMHLYGSSRLGMVTKQTVSDVILAVGGDFGDIKKRTFTRGEKLFELSNHLGNVLVTITDRRQQVSAGGSTVDSYLADINTANDYYPFGMLMPNRSYTAGSQFRYGFNGKENDNDVKGTGNQQDYGMRIYDPRIGKFLSVDPLTKKFSHYSPYTFAANSPVDLIDLIGNEPVKPLTWAKKIWYSLMGQDYLIRLNEFAVTNKIDESNIFYYNYENRSFAIIIDTRIDPYSKEPVEKKHVFRENYIRSGTISSLSPRNDSYYAEIDNYFDDEGRPIPTEDDQSEMTIVWGGGPGRLKNASTLVSGVALMGKSGSKIWTVYTFLTNVPKSGKYFGITIDYARRMAQHGARIIGNPSKLVENIPNKMTAKGIEQLFIEWGRKKGIITQQINSISKNNTQYDKALKLAEDFLKKNYGNKFDFLFSK